jgi:hypothetical protein
VHHRGMVAVAEGHSYVNERTTGLLAGEIHGHVAGESEVLGAACSRQVVWF